MAMWKVVAGSNLGMIITWIFNLTELKDQLMFLRPTCFTTLLFRCTHTARSHRFVFASWRVSCSCFQQKKKKRESFADSLYTFKPAAHRQSDLLVNTTEPLAAKEWCLTFHSSGDQMHDPKWIRMSEVMSKNVFQAFNACGTFGEERGNNMQQINTSRFCIHMLIFSLCCSAISFLWQQCGHRGSLEEHPMKILKSQNSHQRWSFAVHYVCSFRANSTAAFS